MLQIADGLREGGERAYIAFGRGRTPDGVKNYRIGSNADVFWHVLRNFTAGDMGFGSDAPTRALVKFIEVLKPDVIHLHNLHGFYLHIGV